MCVAVVSNEHKFRKHLKNLATFLGHKTYGFSDVLCLMEASEKNKEKVDSVFFHLGSIFDKITFKSLLLVKQIYKDADIIIISNTGLAHKNDYRFDKSILDMGFKANLYENDDHLDSKITDLLGIPQKKPKRNKKFLMLTMITLLFMSTTISTPLIMMSGQSEKMYREVKLQVVEDYLETQDFFTDGGKFRGGVVIVDSQDTIYVNFSKGKYKEIDKDETNIDND